MSEQLFESKVIRLKKETKDSVSVYLVKPRQLTFEPGQFITLFLDIKGESVRRSYSLSSSPEDEHLRITVKVVQGGLVSNYLFSQLQEGDKISFSAPEGFFTLIDDATGEKRPRVFIGAGSGITPLFSMLKKSLNKHDVPHLLLYGNRHKDNIIFKSSIDTLAQEYHQLSVINYISKGSFLKRLFGKNDGFKSGRISPEDVWYAAIDLGEIGFEAEYYICGPEKMNKAIRQELLSRNVEEDRIKVEYYGTADLSDCGINAEAEILLEGKRVQLPIASGTSILDALLDAGYDPPHSCTSGACCTCIAKLTSGEVNMERTDALSKSEIKNGYILTCQATPKTEKLEVDFNIYE